MLQKHWDMDQAQNNIGLLIVSPPVLVARQGKKAFLVVHVWAFREYAHAWACSPCCSADCSTVAGQTTQFAQTEEHWIPLGFLRGRRLSDCGHFQREEVSGHLHTNCSGCKSASEMEITTLLGVHHAWESTISSNPHAPLGTQPPRIVRTKVGIYISQRTAQTQSYHTILSMQSKILMQSCNLSMQSISMGPVTVGRTGRCIKCKPLQYTHQTECKPLHYTY